MRMITVKDSSIKGYHQIRRRPYASIEMLVTPEKENEFHPKAMVVKMPTLENILLKYHKELTREEMKGLPGQKVKDIAGELIGRVPANFCKRFRRLLLEKDVISTTCQSTENPTISKKYDSRQSFKRNPGKKDRRGGGAIIPCSYYLKCNDENYNRIYLIVEGTLRDLEFKGTEKIDHDHENKCSAEGEQKTCSF